MFKDVLQFIGVLTLVLIAVFAIFFLLDTVHLLSGTLESYVSVMHYHFNVMWKATKSFVTGTGLADEAASLLSSGADKLHDVADTIAQDSDNSVTDSTEEVTEEPDDGIVYGSDPTEPEFVFSTPVPET